MSRLLPARHPTRSLSLTAALLLALACGGSPAPPAERSTPTAGAPAVAPRTVTIIASRDATLIESADGNLANGSGPTLFVGRTAQPAEARRRALVAFDVAAALPAGAQVESATLTLAMEHTHAGEEPVSLHRVLAAWGEGDSATSGGKGAPAAPGDATWLHASSPDRLWAHPGGDFAPDPSATAEVGGEGAWSWGPTPETARDVAEWLRDPASNFGWLLLGEEDDGPTAKRFASRESEAEATRPRLEVTYRPPAGD